MAYKACLVDNVFFCRWIKLDGTEHTFLLYEVERLAKQSGGRLNAMIVVVPENVGMPDEKFRRAGIHSTKAVLNFVDHLIMVIEGRGMKFTVMRAAAAAMATVSGVGARAAAEDTLENAVNRVSGQLSLPVATVLQQATQQGIVHVG